MTAGACPVCSRDRLLTLLRRPRALVHQNLPAPSREHALAAPRGDVHLVLCVDCGFCFNAAFQESLLAYSGEYETGQIHSPTFRRYLECLARDLVDHLRLFGKTIVEIGCGKGEFLSLLCDGGGNTGIGLDPSFVPGRDPVPARCTILPVPHGAVADLGADFVLARHVIEHLPDPGALVATMRRALGSRAPGLLFPLGGQAPTGREWRTTEKGRIMSTTPLGRTRPFAWVQSPSRSVGGRLVRLERGFRRWQKNRARRLRP